MSWRSIIERLIKRPYTPPALPVSQPTPTPIFTPDEMANMVDEHDLLTNKFDQLQQLAIKLRRAGKFKKIDNSLLNKFDKFVGVDFSAIEGTIPTREKETSAKKRKSSS